MNPHSETIRFLIWSFAAPRDWQCTRSELRTMLAERGYTVSRLGLRNYLQQAGWNDRLPWDPKHLKGRPINRPSEEELQHFPAAALEVAFSGSI